MRLPESKCMVMDILNVNPLLSPSLGCHHTTDMMLRKEKTDAMRTDVGFYIAGSGKEVECHDAKGEE